MTTADRNLITLFRGYYRIGVHHYIGISGHAMFTGLLYKFNELNFPESLKISVSEMLSLSGISDVRTFRNARKKLTNYLHNEDDPESWIVKYTEGNIKEYGSYEINYVILLEYYSKVTVELHNDDENGNITVKLQESSSKKSRLRSKIDPYVDPKSAKNALLSNTIQENTILDQTDRLTCNIEATKNDLIDSEIDSQDIKKEIKTHDENGRYRSAWQNNFDDDNSKKRPPPVGNTELDDFKHIMTFPRDTQLILIKRLDAEKAARFYEFVKGENDATE